MTEHIGLTGTINSTFNEPYEVARQFASLDHLSGGRAAWNVVTSWDAFTGENFRRGGYLAQDDRYERARTFLATANELLDSWHGDEILADAGTGRFLATDAPGAFRHRDAYFDIAGQFNVPRCPQGRPVIFQAGDSDEGRDFAAASADAIFSRHSTLKAGQAFYEDVKGRLPKFGRTRGELLILPAATFVLGDTDDEAAEAAREVRRAQVSPQTALKFIEQLWNTELSGFDVDGPLPAFDPVVSDELISKGRASVRQFAKDPVALAGEWRARAASREPVGPGGRHRDDRPAVVHRIGGDDRHDDQRTRPGRRRRRLHPGPAHHPRRTDPVHRQGGAAAAGARRVPRGLHRHDAARPPGPRPAGAPRPDGDHPGRRRHRLRRKRA